MRKNFLLLHRYAGLGMTLFLIIEGLTGSLLAFYPELVRLANPHWYTDRLPDTWLNAGTLANRIESDDARLQITQVELVGWDGATDAWVEPRTDPSTGATYKLDFNRLILDPSTGTVLDRIDSGSLGEHWSNIMGFVYDIHYSLALGMNGMWILGLTALIWTLDCFVGFYLTFPVRSTSPPRAAPSPAGSGVKRWWARWKQAWKIRWKAHRFKMNFDLHRAGGLWLWGMLLVFAWSSVEMNLWDTVYTWATRAVFDYRPPWNALQPLSAPVEHPLLGWIQAQAIGEQLMAEQATQHGFSVKREIALRYDPELGVYTYQVESNREIDDRPRRYTTQVSFDGNSGGLKLLLLPMGQHTGNTVSNWLYALHMANVFGLPYRIFVCALGLIIIMLAVTGIYIWWKKFRSRRISAARRLAAAR